MMILYDFQLNTTKSVIVGRDREEVLEMIQRGFENKYNLYDKLKGEDLLFLSLKIVPFYIRITTTDVAISCFRNDIIVSCITV